MKNSRRRRKRKIIKIDNDEISKINIFIYKKRFNDLKRLKNGLIAFEITRLQCRTLNRSADKGSRLHSDLAIGNRVKREAP